MSLGILPVLLYSHQATQPGTAIQCALAHYDEGKWASAQREHPKGQELT
jgi:hypothetical protein